MVMALHGTLTMVNSWMAVTFSGVARSAFDLANQYSKERIQGGKPICQFQETASRVEALIFSFDLESKHVRIRVFVQ